METFDSPIPNIQEEKFHFGHLGAVLIVAIVLVAISWMKDPQLFRIFKTSATSAVTENADVPHYYAYVAPAEDLPQPMVAGASTAGAGPMIINEDGSVTPANAEQVLGASTQDVQLDLDKVSVTEIPDSDQSIKQYFSDAQTIESGYINNSDFEIALSSGDQQKINLQALKLSDIKNNLQKLSVPRSLVKLQKLKIVQYTAAINILNNFTNADENPELVGQYLNQFLSSQQNLDSENLAIQQKYNVDVSGLSAGIN